MISIYGKNAEYQTRFSYINHPLTDYEREYMNLLENSNILIDN